MVDEVISVIDEARDAGHRSVFLVVEKDWLPTLEKMLTGADWDAMTPRPRLFYENKSWTVLVVKWQEEGAYSLR